MTEHEWLVCEDPQRMLRLRRTDCCGALQVDDGVIFVCSNAWPSGKCDNGPVLPQSIFTDRQLRLFACACVRQVWDLLTDDRSRRAVEVAERFADGNATQKELSAARDAARDAAWDAPWDAPWDAARAAARAAARDAARAAARAAAWAAAWAAARDAQAALLREIVGNPYRSLPTEPILPVVARMAQVIYDDRDWDALPMLADRLEDAGCRDEYLLRHLRGEEPCTSCAVEGGEHWPMGWCHVCDGSEDRANGRWMRLRGLHVRGCWALDHVRGAK